MLSLSRTHPHTHPLSLARSPSHTHSVSLALTLSHTLRLSRAHSRTHPLFLSASSTWGGGERIKAKEKDDLLTSEGWWRCTQGVWEIIRSLSLTHTHSLSLSHTHSLSLSHKHTRSLRQVAGGGARKGCGGLSDATYFVSLALTLSHTLVSLAHTLAHTLCFSLPLAPGRAGHAGERRRVCERGNSPSNLFE